MSVFDVDVYFFEGADRRVFVVGAELDAVEVAPADGAREEAEEQAGPLTEPADVEE